MKIRGFTLIEMLLVISMLVVLLMIGISQFTDLSGDARGAVTRDKLQTIREGIVGDPRLVSGGVYTKPGYLGNCLKLPGNITYLETRPSTDPAEPTCQSVYDPLTRLGWNGPYIDVTGGTWQNDAWGTAIQYSSGSRTLTSCGSNLTCGDSDDISVSF